MLLQVFLTVTGYKLVGPILPVNPGKTRDGPVDQVGSTFKIISVQDFVDLAGDYYVKVKVEFSCKLYSMSVQAP